MKITNDVLKPKSKGLSGSFDGEGWVALGRSSSGGSDRSYAKARSGIFVTPQRNHPSLLPSHSDGSFDRLSSSGSRTLLKAGGHHSGKRKSSISLEGGIHADGLRRESVAGSGIGADRRLLAGGSSGGYGGIRLVTPLSGESNDDAAMASPLCEMLENVRKKSGYKHEETQRRPSTDGLVLEDRDDDEGENANPEKTLVGKSGKLSVVAELMQPPTIDARKGRSKTSDLTTRATSAAIFKMKYRSAELLGIAGSRDHEESAQTAGSAAELREVDKEKRKSAKEVISQVYKTVLGRPVDQTGLKHYTSVMVGEDIDRDGLTIMLCQSYEFREMKLREFEGLEERTTEQWENKIYPWKAVEDNADFEPGTVKWEESPDTASLRTWVSGDVLGNNRGVEVFEGRIVYSTMDNWKTVCTHEGFGTGVHWWGWTKSLRSRAGEKGRVGVVVRDTEIDTDFKKEGAAFKDRAFYMSEDGNLWNGDFFVGKGLPFFSVGNVVTLKLDCFRGELSFWVATQGHASEKNRDVLKGADRGMLCGTIKIPSKVVEKGLFPFVQDMYGGSGWTVSLFGTEGPEDLADGDVWVKEQAFEIQKLMGVSAKRLTDTPHTAEQDGSLPAVERRVPIAGSLFLGSRQSQGSFKAFKGGSFKGLNLPLDSSKQPMHGSFKFKQMPSWIGGSFGGSFRGRGPGSQQDSGSFRAKPGQQDSSGSLRWKPGSQEGSFRKF